MNVWICTGFNGHYTRQTAAVVVAETIESAALLLATKVFQSGLPSDISGATIEKLDTSKESVELLADGDI